MRLPDLLPRLLWGLHGAVFDHLDLGWVEITPAFGGVETTFHVDELGGSCCDATDGACDKERSNIMLS